ncbi:SusD/RagB family nutrient-binding outer membrane lipoprotein [Flavihumibacter solisilvae]|uniref:Starch-binding protein n=1 Tax=Flavihumibacter solisilvae TaxID=1349421 RepID=A0A0C1LAH0_9BACT|nr:SusD/RagB family nutrient-binding outer membrane lipoprotein [Flavihumibacter solisilvae]KIC96506.1 hypothetical protein OI18_01915 [Flavihumibacter solisilvae]
MKNIIFTILCGIVLTSGACKKFIDKNDDPNRPINVQEPLILSPVELAISHSLNAGYAAILTQHYTQSVALNQPVPNEGTYLLVNSQMDGDWSNAYATILNNLKVMIEKAETKNNTAYSGVGKILFAYTLGTATDLWGDIPLLQALKGATDFTPAYDKQEDIYASIQDYLDKGIADLDKESELYPGSDDFFYEGDLSKWEKLAYTLKARYYMHLTKAPGNTATELAGKALAALQNGMTANDDDLKFKYPGSAGNENQWYLTFLPGSTLVLSSNTVDSFKSRNDPRMPVIVAPAKATGLYTGRHIGDVNLGSLEDYSIPAEFYGGADAAHYIVNYTEALFLKAEATLIQSGAAAAEPIYQEAILAHMDKLGLNTSSAGVNTYMLLRGTLTEANALQRIMEEKSVANFLNMENWVDWRRTGFPKLEKVPNASGDIPRRMLYPQSELISNPQSQQSAKLTDRLWWDAQ